MPTACRPNVPFVLLLPVLLGAAAVAQPAPRLVLASPEAESAGRFGGAVSSAGDVDGDGVDDLLVGAYSESPGGLNNAGRAYVFGGADGVPLHTLVSPKPEEGGDFGNAVAGLGDVDGDGVPDLAVGAASEDVSGIFNAGRVHVFSGAEGVLLRTLTSPNAEVVGFFGHAVAGVGDVDGDGVDDLLVGARQEDVGGLNGAGRAYVFAGATGGLLRTLESPNPEEGGVFGDAVARVGDTDGDTVDDLIVGADEDMGGSGNDGRAYVFSGATGALLLTLESPNPEQSSDFGEAVAGLGDTDGDGTPDFAVGASREDAGALGAGRAYVFSGDSGALLHTLVSPNPEVVGSFGYALAGLADLDADGVDEIAVAAYIEGDSDGRVYVFAGASGALLATLTTPRTGDRGNFGEALAAVRAADGGGRPGLVVGAPREDVGGVTGGRAYVFAGPRAVAVEPPVPVETAVTVGPNPFRDRAVLTVVLVAPSVVRVSVYDGLGRAVSVLHDGPLGAGSHGFVLDGTALPSGVYGWRLVAGERVEVGRLTLLR